MVEDLGIKVHEEVRAKETFGNIREVLKKVGIAGTLQLRNKDDAHNVIDAAWELSQRTKKIVVVIVRAS